MNTNYRVPTGIIIKEYLDERNIDAKKLALELQVDEKYLVKLLDGKNKLTEEIAIGLQKVLPEIAASYWLNLERKYDEYIEETQQVVNYSKEELKEISINFKFKEVFKGLKWDLSKQATEMLKLLQIDSFDKFSGVYSKLQVDFFQDGGELEPIAIWINLCKEEVELQNEYIEDISYSKENLEKNLHIFKSIAYNNNLDNTIKSCRKLCNKLGIYFVELEPISNSKVRGALLTYKDHPAIFISRRFKTHDHTWFAIAHELGHLIRHYQKDDIIISLEEGSENKKEEEANEFARNLFMDLDKYKEFVQKGDFSSKSIELFAAKNKVVSGIVIARLQHDGYLSMAAMNHKKSR